MKWSDLKRSLDVILAVWPEYKPLHERWFMQELVYRENLAPTWRDRYVPDESDNVFSDQYPDRASAIASAKKLNLLLKQQISERSLDPAIKRSLELKIDKAVQARTRLQEEEALMLAEALRRHERDERPDVTSLKIVPEAERYRQDLFEQLANMPYLQIARVGQSNNHWNQYILYKSPDNVWSLPSRAVQKNARDAERAKIANGFDLAGSSHWGKTKAKIRQMLLPRANQLLQISSVKRLLAEALARGERVLVSNGIVFWHEDDGIGWRIKQTSTSGAMEGETIWREGKILSTNHGRLVVLPYIKESGEHVKGHTKNGPNDGRSLPRHPDEYVEIPFSLYEGDLMIGLFGELPYE